MNSEIGGPDGQRRAAVYLAARLPQPSADLIESLIEGSGARQVGKGALGNVVTRFYSAKNGGYRVLESHTCEQIFAYELELDHDVIGYFTQIYCQGIERIKEGGRKHISAAHIDFLVFRRACVELVECKQPLWLQNKIWTCHPDWAREGEAWICRPYQAWAEHRAIPFRVWEGPRHPAVYQANISALYDASQTGCSTPELRTCARAARLLESGPLSIADLCSKADGIDHRSVLLLLSRQLAFGPLKSVPLADDQAFVLFSQREQADAFDQRRAEQVELKFRSLGRLEGELLSASKTDMAKARARLLEVEEFLAGERPPTRRLRRLAKEVTRAQERGGNGLEACLTRYSRSGNRFPRLDPAYSEIRERVVLEYWNKGKARTLGDLCDIYAAQCALKGLPLRGVGAVKEMTRCQTPERRALALGGMRGYQSVRRNTDPRYTSQKPLLYGALAYIDSTPIDMRFVDPDTGNPLSLSAIFYIAVDGASKFPLGYSFVFGAARTEGLAILMRNIVRRNTFLPRMLHLDRGPENTSRWIQSFCEGRISLRYSPTAGSAWNQTAETALRFANTQVAHQMFGSTYPDRRGRGIDGRLKSLKTARMQFAELHKELSEFIEKTLPKMPGEDGASPEQHKRDLLERFGLGGGECAYSDRLVLETSVPMPATPKPTPRGSIRTEYGSFTSDELQECLQARRKLEEVRADCEDPGVIYCRFKGVWVKAFHRHIQDAATAPILDGIFDLCFAPTLRTLARARKEILRSESRSRIRRAKQENLQRGRPEQASTEPPVRTRKKVPVPLSGPLFPDGE